MSSSHDRHVRGYLNPKTNVLFVGYTIAEEMGMSESINVIMRDFFNRLPKDKLEKYQKAFADKCKDMPPGVSWPV